MFLNSKLVGTILPLELCILATTPAPTHNKRKTSIKPFARKIEQMYVTKAFGS